ncbi:MAG TPA: DUF2231 domain-containing protein [Gemmatimonadales bacterium]
MSMRLQELHPALVHYPIAFLPLAVGADLVGEATDDDRLREVGRIGMVLAAGSAALAAMAGLAAQEEVNVERGSEAYDMLVTHRTINLSTVLAGGVMAALRWRERRASPAYLAAGVAALGAVAYSAYLGGKMVYKHGLGVEAAGGIRAAEHEVPEITRGNVGRAARYVARDAAHGARNAVRQMRDGDVAPMLARGGREVAREPEVEERARGARREARDTQARDTQARGGTSGPQGPSVPWSPPESRPEPR